MAILEEPRYRRYRSSRFSSGPPWRGQSSFSSLPPGRPHRRLRPLYLFVAAVLAVLIAAVAAFAVLATSKATLVSDKDALARVNMPLGGGKVTSVAAFTDPTNQRVPVVLRGNRIWPQGRLPVGEAISIVVEIRRPGWVSWLTGATTRLHLTVTTPTAKLTHNYLTLSRSAPLRIHFDHAVSVIFYGARRSHLTKRVLPAPTSVVTLQRTAVAGSIWVSAVPLSWETAVPHVISWFPAGSGASAVSSPAPGSTIRPHTPIVLTFSKPWAQVLGHSKPPISPATQGTWREISSHALVFRPQGYGYGLGTTVKVELPSAVRLVGGANPRASEVGTWKVPPGSTARLQQLLADLGYLPLKFSGNTVARTERAQETAAVKPPSGTFSWRYPNTPSMLRNLWKPGASGVMTKGAVMAFENDHGLTTDGTAGPAVWKALIAAELAGHRSSFGYTFVMVSEGSPESESTWHNGRTVVSGAVNTGIPAAPTAQGVFPVFLHASSVTMSGTNPDGSHYSDPGVPYVSYFNGGDALHGFIRSSYGSPQSLGCVEMPYSEAAAVYPYTPIGTLVDVY
jgi:peptidoglycan hydrolase-like protein with peptidoglycan-binding domain